MKRRLLLTTALLLLSACEPRDLRLLSDSERSKKGFSARANQEVFFGDTSAAIFAFEKQVEIINALEMSLNHDSAIDTGYSVIDKSSDKNAFPSFEFHLNQTLSLEKTRQEAYTGWTSSVGLNPLMLEGKGSVSLYLVPVYLVPADLSPAPDAKTVVNPPADVKANIEQQDVVVTQDADNKNIYHVKVKAMKITLAKISGRAFSTEVNITSDMDLLRVSVIAGEAPRYTITKSTLVLTNNKIPNGDPIRTLNIILSENFSVHLGSCPFNVGTLSWDQGGALKELVRFQDGTILNLSNSSEDPLISCREPSVRPLVDLSRILKM